MIKIIRLMLVMMTVGLMTGCVPLPRIYLGADDVYGTVLDAETKEPIKDVIVLEMWEQYNGWEGGHYNANLILNETLTDAKGYYRFDGWGPKLTFSGSVTFSSPILVYFKEGYSPISHGNPTHYFYDGELIMYSHKYSAWTGKNIELERYIGSRREYVDKLPGKSLLVEGDVWGSRVCDWKRVPIFTAAMIRVGAIKIDDLEDKKCGVNAGSIADILRKN